MYIYIVDWAYGNVFGVSVKQNLLVRLALVHTSCGPHTAGMGRTRVRISTLFEPLKLRVNVSRMPSQHYTC